MAAGEASSCADQGKVALKGFAEPVRAWAVAWGSGASNRGTADQSGV